MCWSGEASALLAVGGMAGSAIAHRRGTAAELCTALAYFSVMEAVQAFSYPVIGQCSLPANQAATIAAYIHIAFQPFFYNAIALHFIPPRVQKKIRKPVYLICGLAALFYLLRLYPFEWAPLCFTMHYDIPFTNFHPQIPFCGPETCSMRGVWHISWAIPARYVWLFDNSYLFAGFLLPLVYGSWRVTLYHLITGPILAWATTNNSNEWVAVWCLYSVGLMALILFKPLQECLRVKRWLGWKERSKASR